MTTCGDQYKTMPDRILKPQALPSMEYDARPIGRSYFYSLGKCPTSLLNYIGDGIVFWIHNHDFSVVNVENMRLQ